MGWGGGLKETGVITDSLRQLMCFLSTKARKPVLEKIKNNIMNLKINMSPLKSVFALCNSYYNSVPSVAARQLSFNASWSGYSSPWVQLLCFSNEPLSFIQWEQMKMNELIWILVIYSSFWCLRGATAAVLTILHTQLSQKYLLVTHKNSPLIHAEVLFYILTLLEMQYMWALCAFHWN